MLLAQSWDLTWDFGGPRDLHDDAKVRGRLTGMWRVANTHFEAGVPNFGWAADGAIRLSETCTC